MTNQAVQKNSAKLAHSAKRLERSTERVEDSADRRTELAADRTIFAAERTYAAWVRTGLVSLASGVGAEAALRNNVALDGGRNRLRVDLVQRILLCGRGLA